MGGAFERPGGGACFDLVQGACPHLLRDFARATARAALAFALRSRLLRVRVAREARERLDHSQTLDFRNCRLPGAASRETYAAQKTNFILNSRRERVSILQLDKRDCGSPPSIKNGSLRCCPTTSRTSGTSANHSSGTRMHLYAFVLRLACFIRRSLLHPKAAPKLFRSVPRCLCVSTFATL